MDTEHPAYRAAKMIMELHRENIALIDAGRLFMREGVDVSADIRTASLAQIKLCEQIMERAAGMGELHREQGQSILEQYQQVIEEAKNNPDGLATIPEIGNYEHGK